MKHKFPLLLAIVAIAGMAIGAYYLFKTGKIEEILNDETQTNADMKELFNGEVDTFIAEEGGTLDIFSIKHASIAMRAGDKWIYFDPVTSGAMPVTDFDKAPKADYIFMTHDHYDHFDSLAVKQLRKEGTRVFANRSTIDALGSGEAMANGDSLVTEEGWTVEAVPAYNNSPEKLGFHPQGRDNGYVLTIGGLRVYVAGDLEVIPELALLKDIDIAFLPCNLPYTMSPEQCAQAAKIINPKVLFPYHYGGTDTPTDLQRLVDLLDGTGIEVRIRMYE